MTPAWLAVIGAVGLSILGVLAIATTQPGLAARQGVFLLIAVVLSTMVTLPHYRVLSHLILPLIVIVLGLLVFVLLPGIPDAIVHPRKGARRWINLVVMDFQPSELAKLVYILSLAGYLRVRKNYRSFLGLMVPFVLTFVPLVLILMEPDLGTSLLLLPALFAMLIAAGAKLKHLVLIVVLGMAVAPMTYPFLMPHQKGRIQALVYQLKGDDRHVQGVGMQGDRAQRLVGAGGFLGTGKVRAATLIEHNNLPEEHNDMVFAVIACRWGLLGALGTWGLFLMTCVGGLLTAATCKDAFGRLTAVGIVAVLFSQMAINTGMTIGILPITGMTLPFVSYGGSSLVAAWLMIGLILNVGLRPPAHMARGAFEFDEAETAT